MISLYNDAGELGAKVECGWNGLLWKCVATLLFDFLRCVLSLLLVSHHHQFVQGLRLFCAESASQQRIVLRVLR